MEVNEHQRSKERRQSHDTSVNYYIFSTRYNYTPYHFIIFEPHLNVFVQVKMYIN